MFWNIRKKNTVTELVDLCREYNVDVLILSETEGLDVNSLINELKSVNEDFQIGSLISTERILIIHAFPGLVTPIKDSKHFSVYRYQNDNVLFLLVGVHLPSKREKNEKDQLSYATKVIREIEDLEKQFNTLETVIVGDFNMNPFEDGMVSCDGFHAIMCKETALAQSRKIDGYKKYFFYNPSWHIHGKATHETLGSYYYRNNQSIVHFWNMFDQVIIRPKLIEYFPLNDLKIITHINRTGIKLVNKKGRPDASRYSDHLPITFKLTI
ncbi:endonuclease/exonuclease/phosphatase family protein [Brevibacillus dissolubilis]|uniref:endonuclease/exonuclease/phosphatase family protein n=1 Tax=Brevibacillus dissolubilis TaxID=1844116 RepID=UPI0011160CB0|nr:endonuclease/exonuclease/phosphatase family protein [Brevibacillus dissolubilis]